MALVPSLLGRSRYYNGSSGHLSVASADIGFSEPYLTLFIWAFPTINSSADTMIGKWAAGTNDWLMLATTNNAIQFGFGNQSYNSPNGALPAGRWSAVAMTKNGSSGDSIRGFVDGKCVAVSTAATASSCGNTSVFDIGRAANTNTLCWNGWLCHAAVWNVPLSDAEIMMLAQGVLPGQIRPNRLRGWWPMDGAVYNSERDLSGRFKHATLNNTLPIHNNYPPIATPRDALWLPSPLYTTDPGSVAPSNIVAPVITPGEAEEGVTLSCSTGTWAGTPAPTYTYQWEYNDGSWNNISGATSSTWTVDLSGVVDAGDLIRCTVTATNSSGSASEPSSNTPIASAIDFTNQFIGASVS